MRSFWLRLWLFWALWITLRSLLIAGVLSALVTLGLYLYKRMPQIDAEVGAALLEIAGLSFYITWSIGLLVSIFLSVRQLFGRCYANRKLQLLDCRLGTPIAPVRVEDTLKLWRKWLFAIIWAVAAQTVVIAVFSRFVLRSGAMEWFSIYWLFGFILSSALLTMPLMGSRCKMVKVVRC